MEKLGAQCGMPWTKPVPVCSWGRGAHLWLPGAMRLWFAFYSPIFGCPVSSLLHGGLSLVAGKQELLFTVVCGLLIAAGGFSGRGAPALGHQAFTRCGAYTHLICGVWNLSGPEIDPVSQASQGKDILNPWTTREVLQGV